MGCTEMSSFLPCRVVLVVLDFLGVELNSPGIELVPGRLVLPVSVFALCGAVGASFSSFSDGVCSPDPWLFALADLGSSLPWRISRTAGCSRPGLNMHWRFT